MISAGTRAIFAELADMNCDGLQDLILSAGDYPDQWLRLYLQKPGQGFEEMQNAFGLKHDGSQQISLGDIDGDGDPDLIVGQTFNRLNAEQIGGRKPQLRVFINRLAPSAKSFSLKLRGHGRKVSRDALGAIVRLTLSNGERLQRQLIGIGGHAGKQHDFALHFGLGNASIRSVEVVWPDSKRSAQSFTTVKPGNYLLEFGKPLETEARALSPSTR